MQARMSGKRPGYTGPPTQGRSSVGRAAVSKTVGRGFESLRPCCSDRFERELAEVGETGDAHADQTQRSRAVEQAAVEQAAGEIGDRVGLVDSRCHRTTVDTGNVKVERLRIEKSA